MSSDTPGPWKIFEGCGANKRRPVIVDCTPDVDGKFVGNCICYLASTNPDVEANSRMIAAAPEMLSALKAAYQMTSCYQGGMSDAINAQIMSAIKNAETAQ